MDLPQIPTPQARAWARSLTDDQLVHKQMDFRHHRRNGRPDLQLAIAALDQEYEYRFDPCQYTQD